MLAVLRTIGVTSRIFLRMIGSDRVAPQGRKNLIDDSCAGNWYT